MAPSHSVVVFVIDLTSESGEKSTVDAQLAVRKELRIRFPVRPRLVYGSELVTLSLSHTHTVTRSHTYSLSLSHTHCHSLTHILSLSHTHTVTRSHTYSVSLTLSLSRRTTRG